MHSLGASGVWEAMVPGAVPGNLYRFEIVNRHSGETLVKCDPYGRGFELRPGSAAYVVEPSTHCWGDGDWLARRAAWDWQRAPVNIYAVPYTHLDVYKRQAMHMHGGKQQRTLDLGAGDDAAARNQGVDRHADVYKRQNSSLSGASIR